MSGRVQDDPPHFPRVQADGQLPLTQRNHAAEQRGRRVMRKIAGGGTGVRPGYVRVYV